MINERDPIEVNEVNDDMINERAQFGEQPDDYDEAIYERGLTENDEVDDAKINERAQLNEQLDEPEELMYERNDDMIN